MQIIKKSKWMENTKIRDSDSLWERGSQRALKLLEMFHFLS